MSGIKHLNKLHKRRLIYNNRCPGCNRKLKMFGDVKVNYNTYPFDKGCLFSCHKCCINVWFKNNILDNISTFGCVDDFTFYFYFKNTTFDIEVYCYRKSKYAREYKLILDNINDFVITDYFKITNRLIRNRYLE